MKTRRPHTFWMLFLIGILFSVTSCATSIENLAKTGTVSIEIVPSPSRNIAVSEVSVYQDNEELLIKGKVKRKTTIFESGGHVDIAIIDPDDMVIELLSTDYVPRIINRKGARESTFIVRMPIILSEDSTVRVAYHPGKRWNNGIFNCGMNMAVPEVLTQETRSSEK